MLKCPNCGERSVYDYRFGGEVTARPAPSDSGEEWTRYFYFRKNEAGLQREWWYHKYGCRRWFLAERNTLNNRVEGTYWPGASSARS
ncbi:MAG: sarcosine oxidase subunit delta [Chloroflexi bacterium]|nr:sarcosine oxidase subunit delta [Chloroflexota bacterium]